MSCFVPHYLEGVGWLLLSVQWFQGIEKLSINAKNPLIVTRHHQVAVISWQAVKLHRTQHNLLNTSLCSCLIKSSNSKVREGCSSRVVTAAISDFISCN